MSPDLERKLHLAAFAEASRTDVTTDAQGRKVRRRMCARLTEPDAEGRPRVGHFWAVVQDAPRDFLAAAVAQQRKRVADLEAAVQAQADYVNRVLRERGEPEID